MAKTIVSRPLIIIVSDDTSASLVEALRSHFGDDAVVYANTSQLHPEAGAVDGSQLTSALADLSRLVKRIR